MLMGSFEAMVARLTPTVEDQLQRIHFYVAAATPVARVEATPLVVADL